MIIFFLINQILFIVQNVASSILNEWLEDNNEKIDSIDFLHARNLYYSFLYFCVVNGPKYLILKLLLSRSSILIIYIEHGFDINAFLHQVLLNEIWIWLSNLKNCVYFGCLFSFYQKRNPEYEDKVNVIN